VAHKITNRPPRVQAIINQVAAEYDLRPEDLTGRSRARRHAHARFAAYARIVMELEIKGAPPSLSQIGGWFGGRDHTSILHGLRSASTGFEWKGHQRPWKEAGQPNYRVLLADNAKAEQAVEVAA